ncbi:MAG: hypothetical protein WB586_19560 [Chthoniobacterales bacterium]
MFIKLPKCQYSFHVYKSGLLKTRGKFCTLQCYYKRGTYFFEALANDRLKLVLQDTSASSESAQAEAALEGGAVEAQTGQGRMDESSCHIERGSCPPKAVQDLVSTREPNGVKSTG